MISPSLNNVVSEGDTNSLNRKEVDVLVTGGTGFLGRVVVGRLLETGLTVRVTSRRNTDTDKLWPGAESKVQCVFGDISDADFVDMAVQGAGIVIHLVASMGGDWSDHLKTTVNGTENVLQAIKKHRVQDFVYASTLNVYEASSFCESELVDEVFKYESKPELRGYYSHAKLLAEKHVIAFAELNNINTTIFRPGLIYGDELDPVLGDLGVRVGSRNIVCMGRGDRRLPLVHIDSVAEAFNLAAVKRLESINIFNLLDSNLPTQTEYVMWYNRFSVEKLRLIKAPLQALVIIFCLLDFFLNKFLGKETSLLYRLRSIVVTPRFSTKAVELKLGWEPEVSSQDRVREWVS